MSKNRLRFKDANGNEYPAWQKTSLGKISKIGMGFTPSTKDKNNWNGDVVWVAISDMGDSKYIDNSKKKITKSGLGKKVMLPIGRLIMSFKLSIGKLAITKKELVTNEAIANFDFNENINTNFMYYALENKDFTSEGIQAVKGKTLNKDSLSGIEICLPCLEEQIKIASILSKIDEQIELQEDKLQMMKEYKKGIQKSIFGSN